ncbi:unnamed protein product [Vitrella brassicaformis CCMP3155]|uniref:UmuC domain-containing protein n=2 Tax=Vitrella brassicaformis TaxID=1169539 RepID=A0A0G4FTF3_VITBC|nr:unnamed protein product [Vitrella brassicaformis CCMP3155]|eukprot:CEM17749.1 unnamed protein product [Vitrella brassicaformis CCMP3155]
MVKEEDGREGRVVLHLDFDCFYAQVFIQTDPKALADKPVGVTQKYLVITCNYVARRRGVKKLTPITEALRVCPDLILFNGENLRPFREANARVETLLKAPETWKSVTRSPRGTPPPVEKLALDEFFIDISDAVRLRAITENSLLLFEGHVVGEPSSSDDETLLGGRKRRWGDVLISHMREKKRRRDETAAGGGESDGEGPPPDESDSEDEEGPYLGYDMDPHLLGPLGLPVPEWPPTSYETPPHPSNALGTIRRHKIASIIAKEIRDRIHTRLGLTCCGGVGPNKPVSKMVAGLHKPNMQTTILPSAVRDFLAPLPLRKLPGIGGTYEKTLTEGGITTLGQLASRSVGDLVRLLGSVKVATVLKERATDGGNEPVQEGGPPKSLSCEDSLRDGEVTTPEQALRVLSALVAELSQRLSDDYAEHHRLPTNVVLSWRLRGMGYSGRHSRAAPLPLYGIPLPPSPAAIGSAIEQEAKKLLDQHIVAPAAKPTAADEPVWTGQSAVEGRGGAVFHLTLLNVGVSAWRDAGSASNGRTPTLSEFLRRQADGGKERGPGERSRAAAEEKQPRFGFGQSKQDFRREVQECK